MSKSTKAKFGPTKAAKRREELRRNLPKPTLGLRSLLRRPEVVSAGSILLVFIVLVSLVLIWSREQILVSTDRIMTETSLNRLDFTFENQARTEEAREEARQRSPDIYTLDADFLDTLRSPLYNLPVLVAQQGDFESISEASRRRYALDEAAVASLTAYTDEDGNATPVWTDWVDRLLDRELVRRALIASEDWQRGLLEPEPPQLRAPDGSIASSWSEAVPIEAGEDRAELRGKLREIAQKVGFRGDVARYVAAGLASQAQPTYTKNVDASTALADQRARAVPVVRVENRKGDVIYRRGDVLNESQLAALRTEADFYRAQSPPAVIWLPRIGLIGLVMLLLALGAAFVVSAYDRIVRNRVRVLAVALLMTGMLGLTALLAAEVPELVYPAAVAPTLFVALVLLLSYDRRLALSLCAIQCALVVLALGQGVDWFVLLMIGCGTMIGQLREVRNRNTLIRAAIVTAVVLGAATVLRGLVLVPLVEGMLFQVGADAAWAAVASLVIGFLVLGILPSIERLFDITTGMTLAELRDPSQTLLRQLQQRAPGTYNHSLQVANIAEAAADAIGADALLVYVGALYHDIGKMNKPEYFIENQTGGPSKHAKLRPAMSLLVIIGHVKDGIELAREYGLPRAIQHCIESHHGTTLVEYFYHAARTEAEADEKAPVDEVEFRYPGPRPRTKEAALLMLADAVESATRAMTEPNPSRIETLVRELSRKRLLDGQFDECDLTFRELGLVEDAMIARLCAIHHGRISYPTAKSEESPETQSASA